MKISVIITKPFVDTLKFTVLALFFIASIIAGSKTYSQNEDAPTDRNESPGYNQHGSQNDDDPMGKRNGPPPEIKSEPVQMAEHLSGMLTERLNLNENQKSDVYNIVLNYASSNTGSNFKPSELDVKIEEKLTTEQKEKFREYIKNRPHQNGAPVKDEAGKPTNE